MASVALLAACTASLPLVGPKLPDGLSRDQLLTDIATCHIRRVWQTEERAVTDAAVVAAVERYRFDVDDMVQRANDLVREAMADPRLARALPRRAERACALLADLTGVAPGLVRFDDAGNLGNTWLVVRGTIGDGFADEIIARLREEKAIGLLIDSPGGSLGEARRLGRWLRDNGLRVGVDGLCTSACVDVLAGGIDRVIAADAKLGIHQSKVPRHMSTHEGGQLSVVAAALYLREMGIDDSIALAAAAVPNNSMYWISTSEALETGLATRVIDAF